jgi:hypothetical protein
MITQYCNVVSGSLLLWSIGATNRIIGQAVASAIALAFRLLFFCALT